MTKNRLLAIISKNAMYVVIPLMMAACDSKAPNTEAELADVEARLAEIDTKLYNMQQKTDTILADSMKNDAAAALISKDIAHFQGRLKKTTAPKDSVQRRRLSKKIGSLKMDSIMRANAVKEQIAKMRYDEFRAVYKEQDSLRARQAQLMKIKKR